MKNILVRFQHEGDSAAHLCNPANLTKDEMKQSAPFRMLDAENSDGLRELADYLDQRAEDANAHDFVGCHRLLAKLLFDHLGLVSAGQVMYGIAEHGGLNGMNGVCGANSAFKKLKVSPPWNEWKIAPKAERGTKKRGGK